MENLLFHWSEVLLLKAILDTQVFVFPLYFFNTFYPNFLDISWLLSVFIPCCLYVFLQCLQLINITKRNHFSLNSTIKIFKNFI
ncbi:hypothetical protein ERO13_D13G221050v2 [Gossypium hirsutum]|nr:hypothetical protein ERO13_D13G221050v2 [Gossypium hirsutum]